MTFYKPLQINLLAVYGLLESMLAMRLPKGGLSDTHFDDEIGPSDADLASRLVRAGSDHAKAIRGVNAYFRLEMQTGWMIEFETYRAGVECLSTSSSMHQELRQLSGEALAEQKQADLPAKVYTRVVVISYQALRAMYRARRLHRHPDWRIFCQFIETMPHFSILIYPEIQDGNSCEIPNH